MGIRRRLARQRALIVVAAVAVVFAVTAAVPAAAGASTLTSRIVRALKAHGFAGSTTGVRVYNLSTATALYERRSTTQLLPASNEKLVTSSTALADWGADFHFKTELLTTGTVNAKGVYTGKIYLKGFGDPSLTTARLTDFVTALQNATVPVKKIVGNVVGDDSYFDSLRAVPNWQSDMTDYCGPLSALALNEDYRPDGKRASDPPLFVAAQLTALLRKAGISVSGKATSGVTPASAQVAYVEKSPALWRILASMNKPSDNFYAEMLTKGLGAQFAGGGTTALGVKAEGAFLVSLGLGAKTFDLADGSGLSYYDRLTTLDITKLLTAMSRRTDWKAFWHSLSVAGVDGTLSARMRGTPAKGNLRGKTGTLTDASNLSGYVKAANGDWLVFSVLMNKSDIDVSAAHVAQDAIGVALARSRPGGKVVWAPNPAP